MGEQTGISWADRTFNGWIGCTKVSPACENCYAAVSRPSSALGVAWGAGKPRHRTSAANWKLPLRWNAKPFYECKKCLKRGDESDFKNHRPFTVGNDVLGCDGTPTPTRQRVFCASLADVFDNEVPTQWRDELFGLIAATPNLDWLVLTKRIGNASAYLTDTETLRRVDTMKHVVLAGRLEELHAAERISEIIGWPGYFVTSKGRVLSDRTNAGTRGAEMHQLKPQLGKAGHARVMLQVAGQTERPLVHRLVLTAFDRQPCGDEQGCHIDGDATNNALWNLRWGDQSSNWSDSKRHGTRRRYSKVTIKDVETIRTRSAGGEAASAIAPDFGISDTQVRNIVQGNQWKPEIALEWPLPMMWLGATICNQAEADRDIPKLLRVPASVRFLSIEPMLGAVDLTRVCDRSGARGLWINSIEAREANPAHAELVASLGPAYPYSRIDWVITGAESGSHARPSEPQLFRSIRDQCAAAGTAYLHKQNGEFLPADADECDPCIDPTKLRWSDGSEWHESDGQRGGVTLMARVGKKTAGRLLDGKIHHEFPEVRHG